MKKVTVSKSLDDGLAVVTVPTLPSVVPKPKRKSRLPESRFIFEVEEDFVAEMRAANAPKVVVADNQEVLARVAKLEKVLPPELKGNIALVRNFFLQEVAPLTLALGTGVDHAQEVIKKVAGVDLEPSTFVKFEKMAHAAVHIRMAAFLENYLKLPKGAAEDLLTSIAPRPKEAPPAPAPVTPSEPQRSRESKTLHRVLQRLADAQQRDGGNRGNSPVEG